ncbi:hypothetical protein B0H14DRAFT_3496557 [Mycena olivaceomarginata]|nr:hypothetical protein B0H14DRAFT_3496557 [Mycena olivaceomarginata]
MSLVVRCQPPSLLSSRTVGPPRTLTFTLSVSFWSPPRGVFNIFSGLRPSYSPFSSPFPCLASFPPLSSYLALTFYHVPVVAATASFPHHVVLGLSTALILVLADICI